MTAPLVECVPNFSEGRDRSIVDALELAVTPTRAVKLLDSTMDTDHNRSVLTFAGPPQAVVDAALAAASVAVEQIDLGRHTGVHPRIGALDVLPFVPLQDISLEECAILAVQAAERIWETLRVPAYLYEAAARRMELRNLAEVRRTSLPPDVGGPELHPTAGAVVVGARRFLIAFNVNLDTADLEAARRITRAVRESSGGLRCVKALGLRLASRGTSQVSMNLTDFEITPIHVAYEAVCRAADACGVGIRETEFIGLVPRRAYQLSVGKVPGLDASLVLEDRWSEAP
jgi:glutamate formiminotransferase/glutamate formiminotransferase/formiminotetrahydrofolate cyclodeaminase